MGEGSSNKVTIKNKAVKKKQPKLYIKKILDCARLPEVAHAGEDLAYDLFAAETALLIPGRVSRIRCGFAMEFSPPHGALIRDRSSMAGKGVRTSGGVIDAGYRGEMAVFLTLDMNAPPSREDHQVGGYKIFVGDKIAQMVPTKPNTSFVVEQVGVLSDTERGEKGFGSTGV